MFHEKQVELAQRQAELLARSSALRESLVQDAASLERPFAMADNVRHGFGWLASHPYWILIGLAAPLLLRPKKLAGWTVKAVAYWRVWRRARQVAGLLELFNSPGKRWRAR